VSAGGPPWQQHQQHQQQYQYQHQQHHNRHDTGGPMRNLNGMRVCFHRIL
jgi:hypothetical protein